LDANNLQFVITNKRKLWNFFSDFFPESISASKNLVGSFLVAFESNVHVNGPGTDNWGSSSGSRKSSGGHESSWPSVHGEKCVLSQISVFETEG